MDSAPVSAEWEDKLFAAAVPRRACPEGQLHGQSDTITMHYNDAAFDSLVSV